MMQVTFCCRLKVLEVTNSNISHSLLAKWCFYISERKQWSKFILYEFYTSQNYLHSINLEGVIPALRGV